MPKSRYRWFLSPQKVPSCLFSWPSPTRGKHYSDFCHHRLLLPVNELNVNKSIQCVFFCSCNFLIFYIFLSQLIVNILYSFKLCNIVVYSMYSCIWLVIGLFCSTWCFWNSSMMWYVSVVHPLLLLSISLYECTKIYLFSYWWKFGVFPEVLLWF